MRKIIQIVKAWDRATGKTLTFLLGRSCVTIPAEQLQASDAFADAVNKSIDVVNYELDSGELAPSIYAIRSRYIQLVKTYLQTYNPLSAFSTAQCQGTVTVNSANYNC